MTDTNEKIGTEFSELKSKKSKFRKRIIALLLVCIFIMIGIAGISYSQKVKDAKRGGPWLMILDKLTPELNLSDQQKSQVNQLKDEIKTKMESKKKDKDDGMADFENAFKQNTLDKQTLESIYKTHDADREEMRGFFMDEIIKFHNILTPDQRSKAVDKMKEFKDKMHKNKPETN